MKEKSYQTNHRRIATALSIIPGLGQLYNKQYLKGIAFLILTGAFFGVFADLLNMGLWGIFTLGEQTPRDHSIFLMVEGILAVIVLLFGIGFYLFNLNDAYKNGLKKDMGERISTVKEQYNNLIDNGFPYLIMSPGFL